MEKLLKVQNHILSQIYFTETAFNVITGEVDNNGDRVDTVLSPTLGNELGELNADSLEIVHSNIADFNNNIHDNFLKFQE